jgi:hypothetical protein
MMLLSNIPKYNAGRDQGRPFMKWIVTALGLIALMIGAASRAWALSPEDLVGTWKLLSTVRQWSAATGSRDRLHLLSLTPPPGAGLFLSWAPLLTDDTFRMLAAYPSR